MLLCLENDYLENTKLQYKIIFYIIQIIQKFRVQFKRYGMFVSKKIRTSQVLVANILVFRQL